MKNNAVARYNLALLPPPATASRLFKLAASYKKLADGYLLQSKKSMPHLTMTQFYATPDILPNIWRNCLAKMPNRIDAILHSLIFRDIGEFGRKHKNHCGIWIGVKPNQTLLDLQKKSVALIKKTGGDPITPSEGFEPHFTICRSKKLSKIPSHVWPEFIPSQTRLSFSIGHCDDMGQYTGIIYSSKGVHNE